MREKLLQLKKDFAEDLEAVQSSKALDEVRIKYLGRKEGLVTRLFEEFKALSLEAKRELGPLLNSLKQEVEQSLREQTQNYESAEVFYDLSVPPIISETGNLHPITKLQKEIEEIFSGLGFDVALGPEIESDFYNFEALNIPPDHPARDMQDTFYLDLEHPKKHPGKDILLRTHISNMQVRYMEKHKPPFAVILPGRVFRNEALDASHEHTYQYLEGFVVDK
ncbi:MAG TPA: phenylalanine--tRNA ligase subunit alpha, partial [Flavobacterium sp.]|nr:phenylalanine--tRNA ligase subunit alpha [Flavobacterium sp.]